MTAKELGIIIKQRRKVVGLTIRELSEITSISKTTISETERGMTNPTFEVLQTIFKYLNLELSVEVKQQN